MLAAARRHRIRQAGAPEQGTTMAVIRELAAALCLVAAAAVLPAAAQGYLQSEMDQHAKLVKRSGATLE